MSTRLFSDNDDDPILTYEIEVDYSLSLQQMIDAGNYGAVCADVNSSYFPLSGEGRSRMELILVQPALELGRDLTTHEVKSLIATHRLGRTCPMPVRCAKIEELVALGAQRTELLTESPIVALGSIWRNPPSRSRYPAMDYRDGERRLILVDDAGDWVDASYQFAVVLPFTSKQIQATTSTNQAIAKASRRWWQFWKG